MNLLLLLQALLAAGAHPVNARGLENRSKPVFLDLKSSVVDTCKTDAVCDLICEADFEVYSASRCHQYCHDDIDYIWDVFDSYCGRGCGDGKKFCTDLCADGFYCRGRSCRACEAACMAHVGMVQEIFDYCADCDDKYEAGKDDYKTATTTTTTTTTADKCTSIGCWCTEICDIVKCPHCKELCLRNEAKVWPVFERYCECGFCYEADGEDAGLLQFRVQSATSDSGCGCRSEHQYCLDLCRGMGYHGPGLGRCAEDCSSSGKIGGVLEDYCHECHKDYYEPPTNRKGGYHTDDDHDDFFEDDDHKHVYKKDDYHKDDYRKDDYHKDDHKYEKGASRKDDYHKPTKDYKTTSVPKYYTTTSTTTTTEKYYETTSTTEKYYESTTPKYYESTTPKYYETTEPYYDTTEPYYDTTEPYYDTTEPYYGARVPYYWKIKAAKAKAYAAKKYYYAKGKAAAFKYTHPDYFGKYPKKEMPYYWKVKAAKAKGYATKAEYEAKAKAAYFKYRHPEVWGKYYKYKK